MANRAASALALRDGDREDLVRLTRSTAGRAGLAIRARIVLLAADGVSNSRDRGTGRSVAADGAGWRDRYQSRGIAGLADEDRPGRPRIVDHRKVVAATLKPPPKKIRVTHWSSRLLGRHLGSGNATVAKAWREYGVQPWLLRRGNASPNRHAPRTGSGSPRTPA